MGPSNGTSARNFKGRLGLSFKRSRKRGKEYWERLKKKFTEEVGKFLKEPNNEEELADILEVIYAICDFKKIDKKKLEKLREKKVKERGKFKKRIILDGIESNKNSS